MTVGPNPSNNFILNLTIIIDLFIRVQGDWFIHQVVQNTYYIF